MELKAKTITVDGQDIHSRSVLQQEAIFEESLRHIVSFRTWTSEAMPFGVLSAEIEFCRYEQERLLSSFVRIFELSKTGDGAVSLLPNCN